MLEGPAPTSLLDFIEDLIKVPPEDYEGFSFVLEVSVDQKVAALHVRGAGRGAFDIGFLRYVDEVAGEKHPPSATGDMTRYTKVTDETFRELHRLFPRGSDHLEEAIGAKGARR